MFNFYVKCAEDGCNSKDERDISDVYTTHEMQLALEMGHKILKIFKV